MWFPLEKYHWQVFYPYSEGILWLCYAETLDALLHLDGRVTANHNKVVLSDLYPSMKYFYPDYSGLLLDVSHSIWLNEHML